MTRGEIFYLVTVSVFIGELNVWLALAYGVGLGLMMCGTYVIIYDASCVVYSASGWFFGSW